MLAQHHWPTWGNENLTRYLTRQRDLYKFLHDQTLRLAGYGYNATEIAEQIRLPASLEKDWATHGLYGSVSHNVKAIYQRYLGWYDANPANLNPLPTTLAAKKQVEYMGGAAAVLERAKKDLEKGEYRWVAQVGNQVVQADPDNEEAREITARALEQLGYQAESATWRNAYLLGAQELRSGVTEGRALPINEDFLKALSIENIFDYLAVRLNPQKAAGKKARINWVFTDIQQKYVLNLENSALTFLADRNDPAADVSLSLERGTFGAILAKRLSFREAYVLGKVSINGDSGKLAEVLESLDTFPSSFPIVTPRKPL